MSNNSPLFTVRGVRLLCRWW